MAPLPSSNPKVVCRRKSSQGARKNFALVSGLCSTTMAVSFLLTDWMPAPRSSRIKVNMLLFPHESPDKPISFRNEYGIIASIPILDASAELKTEFFGMSLITALTVKGYLFSMVMVLPTGLSSPKYFFASFSDRMIECGSRNADRASPDISGSVKTFRIPESAALTWVSKKTLSPMRNSILGRKAIRAVSLISGIRSFQTGAQGWGVTGTRKRSPV